MSRGPRAVEVVLSMRSAPSCSAGRAGRWRPASSSGRASCWRCADGKPNTHVAAEFKVSADTVRKWRSRFAARRMAGLADEPRPGRRNRSLCPAMTNGLS
ncbi:helix-turn-helix domain-containing protein [Streptomyces sp. NPDC017943]|uniref:helix-turn-helix domain-containing protein n=1 Tax=Streptomyces sp. NPDC017943 TaxID=3365019 RepID=UPI003789B42E